MESPSTPWVRPSPLKSVNRRTSPLEHQWYMEGLEVAMHEAPEEMTPDLKLPEVYYSISRKSASSSNNWGKEVLERRSTTSSRQKQSFWTRPVKTVLLAVIVGVLAVGVILGTIYGWKATHPQPENRPDPAPTPQPTVPSSTRVSSTHGAWNATGIAAFTSALEQFWGFVVYQDYTGKLQEVRWTFDNRTVTELNTRSVDVQAANGTALKGSVYRLDSHTYYYHVIYVDQSNRLADIWRNRTDVDAPWSPGNLSALNFRAPTDNRAALGVEFDPNVPSTSMSPNATRLWAGGSDGGLHQLTLNWTDWSWSRNDTVMPRSYAYGAAASAYGYGADGTANSTVYNTLANGTTQLHFSIDGDPHDGRAFWPSGSWLDPVNTSMAMAPNSSAFASWNTSCQLSRCDSYLLYPDETGRLSRTLLDSSKDDTRQIGALDTSFAPYQMMVGSDLTGAQGVSNEWVLFHQTEGSDISWLVVYDNGTQVNNGRLNLSQ